MGAEWIVIFGEITVFTNGLYAVLKESWPFRIDSCGVNPATTGFIQGGFLAKEIILLGDGDHFGQPCLFLNGGFFLIGHACFSKVVDPLGSVALFGSGFEQSPLGRRL
jgi:hypothetical protein